LLTFRITSQIYCCSQLTNMLQNNDELISFVPGSKFYYILLSNFQ
jgi:hypothetical protein